jgi:hypothetical protein
MAGRVGKGVPPPGYLSKSPDVTESKGVDFFESAQERKRVRKRLRIKDLSESEGFDV